MKTSSQIAIDARRKMVNEKDFISILPDDVLHKTLSRLSTAEAVRTSVLSSRWIDLWKWRPTLELDLRKDLEFNRPTINNPLHEVSQELARPSTKVINNHCGDLESCIIHHYKSQCNDSTLKFVIQLVTRLKKAKELTLVTYMGWRQAASCDVFSMEPDTFSYPNLTSLSLCGCGILGPRFFENCSNLKTLKLINIIISRSSDVANVLAGCSSLQILVLELRTLHEMTLDHPVNIENNNLKYLQVTFHDTIKSFRVDAASLVVLDIRFIKGVRDYDFVFHTPNLGFSRNYWTSRGFPHDHVSYNICSLAQETRSVWHELMVNGFNDKRRHGSLSVSVDLTNPKEVEIFKEILLMWTTDEMKELEIVFKRNNDHVEERESTINGCKAENKLWNDTNPFPYVDFRVHTVLLYNLDTMIKEELALVSQFVMQKMVTKKIMFEVSKFSMAKMLEVQEDMGKLRQLSKRLGNKGLIIQYF